MNFRLCLIVVHLFVSVYAWSTDRYNNRVLRRINKIERYRRTETSNQRTKECLFNICEHVDSYPEDKVGNIIAKFKSLHSYFGDSVIAPGNFVSIAFRNNGEEPEPFCKTKDVAAVPKLMLDVDHVERHIANTEEHQQVIKYQVCDFDNGGDECYTGNLLNLKTKCMQKYNVIKLISVNLEDNSLEYRKFQIPSTCVCTYTKLT